MYLEQARRQQLARDLAVELDLGSRLTLKQALPVAFQGQLPEMEIASMEVRLRADLDQLDTFATPEPLLAWLDAALGGVMQPALKQEVRDAIGAVLARGQAEPVARPPRHHLWCDRAPEWEALGQLLGSRPGVVVVPGPDTEGHEYFAARVAGYARRFGGGEYVGREVRWRDGGWPASAVECVAELWSSLGYGDRPDPGTLHRRLGETAGDGILVLVHPSCAEADRDVVLRYHADLASVLKKHAMEAKVVRVQPVVEAPPGWMGWITSRMWPGLAASLRGAAEKSGTARAGEIAPLAPIERGHVEAFATRYVRAEHHAELLTAVWRDSSPSRDTFARLGDYLARNPTCLQEPEP